MFMESVQNVLEKIIKKKIINNYPKQSKRNESRCFAWTPMGR